MADIFSEAPTNAAEPVAEVGLNDLVGEGKKYSDPDALAKAYANIEAHARRLEAENAQARAERDALEANTNNSVGREQPKQEDPPAAAPTNEAPKQDFRSQIREEVMALNESERAKANAEAAATRMIEVYGDSEKARKAVSDKAAELGVSVEWLRDSASRSPAAFYATMGLGSTPAQSTSTPASTPGVRVGNNGEGVKNFEYFDRIRKENPKLYFSAATQSEMMRQARTMGSDFYKR